jgi:hypothetical protein
MVMQTNLPADQYQEFELPSISDPELPKPIKLAARDFLSLQPRAGSAVPHPLPRVPSKPNGMCAGIGPVD